MICPKCSASLNEGAKFCDTCGNTVDTTEKDPMLGRILLNQYVIQKKLGEGGYGSVYEAEQPAFRRKVAIKTLHKHLCSDPKVVKRFHREGMVASQLEQNISAVKMLNVGETEDGYLWIAMEFIQGETLDDRIQRGPISLAELIGILGPVCNLLDEAHQKTIIHRDLKPDNIMLTTHQGKVIPKVLDFGIAGIVDHQETSRPTQTGTITGTPPYMPPEQWRGLKYTDHRSDIYSLGVIVYECLSGKLPFEADTVPDWMIRHVMQAPREFAAVMAKNPPPKNVEKAVMKALEKEPKDRFQSAGEFFRAIEASADSKAMIPATINEEKVTSRQAPGTTPTLPHVPMPAPITMPVVAAPVAAKKNNNAAIGGAAIFAAAVAGYFLLGSGTENKKIAPPIDLVLSGQPDKPDDLFNKSTPTENAKTPDNKPAAPSWVALESGTKADLYAIYGSAANNIYAVGDGGTVAHSTDAKTWQINELDLAGEARFAPGQVSEIIQDVWVNEKGQAFLVHDGTLFNGSGSNWDGIEIARRGSFHAIWSAPGSPLVVAGNDAYTSNDAVNWQRAHGLGLRSQILSLWGRGGEVIFAVGEGGLLAQSRDQGQGWVLAESSAEVSFNDVHGDSKQVYVAGDNGVILVGNAQGSSWKQSKTNVTNSLQSVWVTANGSIYAVGTGGLILYSDNQGKSWAKQESETTKILYDIWGSPSDLLFVVGEDGTILTLQ